MRLVTRNCNFSLSRKLDLLLNLQPDIAVIQECEESLVAPKGYIFKWRGNSPKKGLGILLKEQEVAVNPLMKDEWTYFLPITLPKTGIRLLATWTYNHRAPRFGPCCIGYPIEVLRLCRTSSLKVLWTSQNIVDVLVLPLKSRHIDLNLNVANGP